MVGNMQKNKGHKILGRKSIVKETVSEPELRELVEYSQERENQQSKGKTVNSPDIAMTERGQAQSILPEWGQCAMANITEGKPKRYCRWNASQQRLKL